jgi:ubiquinone/menaquinone biosynthesis C-methylase UbiE
MRRVLDLGCGCGTPIRKLFADARVYAVDLRLQSLETARQSYPDRVCVNAVGEQLPFPDSSFDLIVSNVGLPYMHVPRVLAEVNRVLVPGGKVWFAVHGWRFTLRELRSAFPRPVALLYRTLVFANGILLHFGRTLGMESFQTESGMRRALSKAQFEHIAFKWSGRERLIVEAQSKEPLGRMSSRADFGAMGSKAS